MEVGYCESEYEAAMLDLLVSLGWTNPEAMSCIANIPMP